jgi:hypothetical protein
LKAHPVATAKAVVLNPNAPSTPNLSMFKNTVTTNAFNGIPNRFITTERWLSGKYFERSVPIVGKYIPTHDSKRKRLSIRTAKSDPGVDASPEANGLIGDRIVDITGSDVRTDTILGVVVEIAIVAVPMARAANPSIPTAKFSVETDVLFPSLSTLLDEVNCPNSVDPRRQHAMKQENTVPYGVPTTVDESLANLAKYDPTALLTTGGQFSTKMYIALSNNACIAPTSMIFGSSFTTFTASRIVGLDLPSSPPLLLATFSFHISEDRSPPKIRNPTDTSKGPVGPL